MLGVGLVLFGIGDVLLFTGTGTGTGFSLVVLFFYTDVLFYTPDPFVPFVPPIDAFEPGLFTGPLTDPFFGIYTEEFVGEPGEGEGTVGGIKGEGDGVTGAMVGGTIDVLADGTVGGIVEGTDGVVDGIAFDAFVDDGRGAGVVGIAGNVGDVDD